MLAGVQLDLLVQPDIAELGLGTAVQGFWERDSADVSSSWWEEEARAHQSYSRWVKQGDHGAWQYISSCKLSLAWEAEHNRPQPPDLLRLAKALYFSIRQYQQQVLNSC